MNGWGDPGRWQLVVVPDPVRQAGPIRIGDAERDAAIASLGDHFAAGRLSRDELDERVDAAMVARFQTDLEPIFADLPQESARRAGGPAGRPGPPRSMGWLFPLLVVAVVVTAAYLGAPWILGALLWLFIASRFWHHAHHHRGGFGPPPRR